MPISQRTIEAVKERASLVDVAGETVKLRRQGSSVVGLCPFHSERSPSFHIRDSGRYFHCFGCGAAGNVISFVMQIRGLSFPDAVTELASRYGVRLELEQGTGKAVSDNENAQRNKLKEEVFKINAVAQRWFQDNFNRPNSPAPRYLIDRGVGIDALKEFGIGYAPPEFGALGTKLTQLGVSRENAISSGLVRRSERGDPYDTFRSRVTFPICDERRRVIGFGGRLIGEEERDPQKRAPKYLNSPETAVYEKSKVFYGLPQAMMQLRAKREAIIVEGYFDVIGLWQAGVQRALATCGTALTESHVKRLVHLVRVVTLLFDGDAAGIAAAGKVFPLFINSGLDVQVVALPAGEDPDTFALAQGEQTETALGKLPRRPLLDCYIEYLASGAGVAPGAKPHELAPAAKGKVAAQLGALLSGVRNEVEKAELFERSRAILRVDEGAFLKMVSDRKTQDGGVPTSDPAPSESKVLADRSSAEPPTGVDRDLLMAVMAFKGELPGMILRDGSLCELLSPLTIEFMVGFEAVLTDSGLNDAQRKEATKGMLQGYGPAWISLWKDAHNRFGVGGGGTPRGDGLEAPKPEALIEHARVMARRKRVDGLLAELEQGLSSSTDDGEKLALAKAKVELERRLRAT